MLENNAGGREEGDERTDYEESKRRHDNWIAEERERIIEEERRWNERDKTWKGYIINRGRLTGEIAIGLGGFVLPWAILIGGVCAVVRGIDRCDAYRIGNLSQGEILREYNTNKDGKIDENEIRNLLRDYELKERKK